MVKGTSQSQDTSVGYDTKKTSASAETGISGSGNSSIVIPDVPIYNNTEPMDENGIYITMKNLLFSAEGDEPIPGVGGFQKENGGSRLNAAIDNELITIKAYLNGLGPSDQKTEFISHVSLWNRSARDAVLAVSDYKKSLDPADYDNIGTFGLSNQAALPSYLKTVFVENAEDLIKTVAVYLNEQGRKEDAVKFYSLYGPALVDENQVQAMVTDYQNLNINVALINANASPILNEGVAVVLESVGTPYWIATRNALLKHLQQLTNYYKTTLDKLVILISW